MEWGIIVSVLTLIVTAVMLPIVGYHVKRNDKMHDTNTAVLAKHSEALAILIEKSNAAAETTRTVSSLTVQVARLSAAIEGARNV